MNLSGIYKTSATLNRLLPPHQITEFKPDNPDAHTNLGEIYRNLGNLDQALASTLKSLALKPEGSQVLKTWTYQMAQGADQRCQKKFIDFD